MVRLLKISLALAAFSLMLACGREDRTYCNPVDLDYGWGVFKLELPLCRTAADPAIVLFKDKYYLFSTHDVGGYRVSDNLLDWSDRKFNEEVSEAALNYGSYVAPAVAADENYVYFIKLNRDRKSKTVKIIRSADPDKGKWEVCGEIKRVADPSLFIDNGRYFIFYGLGEGIRRFELDPETFEQIEGSELVVVEKPRKIEDLDGGYNFGRREIYDEIEAPQWKGNYRMLPCQEGSWVIKRDSTYYMQFATPGTICIWYCDVVATSSAADGEYTIEPYNPVSLKAGGFIGGAGHSGVFMDRYGNWWEITTMWVGNSNEFERRLGLFPVSFDEKGRMRVHTFLGDYPMTVPQRKFDPRKESTLKGWWNLSSGKAVKASSSLEGFPAEAAADENVRTWWAADSTDRKPVLEMDLGSVMTVNALQMNFAEQNYTPDEFSEDYTAYKVYSSTDGIHWKKIIDKSRNRRTNPHEYVELAKAARARYIRLECVHAMNGQTFAVRDLRVFGNAGGEAPASVQNLTVVRDPQDERFAQARWTPVEGADGYLLSFGPSEDFMNQTIQIKGGEADSLLIHILTRGVDYVYKIQAYNGSGISE